MTTVCTLLCYFEFLNSLLQLTEPGVRKASGLAGMPIKRLRVISSTSCMF